MYPYLTSALTHGDNDAGNNDVAEFERKFPDAAAWLNRRNLEREMLFLRKLKDNNSPMFGRYNTDRLAELEVWYTNITLAGDQPLPK